MAEKFNIGIEATNVGPHKSISFNMSVKSNETVLFAGNGTGKTFLSRMFRIQSDSDSSQLSDRYLRAGESLGSFAFSQTSDGGANRYYEVRLNRGQKPAITEEDSFLFHVFNSDFVKDNLALNHYCLPGEISGMYVGKQVISLEEEKEELRLIAEEGKKKKASIEAGVTEAIDELKQAGVSSNLKDLKQITAEYIIGLAKPDSHKYECALNKQAELNALDPESVAVQLAPIGWRLPDQDELKRIIEEAFAKGSYADDLAAFMKTNGAFVERGVEIVDESKDERCPFCRQRLSPNSEELIEEYRAYLNNEESKTISKINGLKQSLRTSGDLYTRWYASASVAETRFAKLKSLLPSLADRTFPSMPEATILAKAIDGVIGVLDEKIEDISQTLDSSAVDELFVIASEAAEACKLSLEEVNVCKEALERISKEKTEARRNLCLQMTSKLRIDLDPVITEHQELTIRWRSAKAKFDEMQAGCTQPMKNVVAHQFKKLIGLFFGSKYEFDEDNFLLSFAGGAISENVDEVLSDGEQSIIAFCYYLASTPMAIRSTSDWERLYFVIDDPITSLDYQYVYKMAQIIREIDAIASPEESLSRRKYLVLTHNADFYNILSKNKIAHNRLLLSSNGIAKARYEMIMPYQEHLRHVYKVAVEESQPEFYTGNSIRHVLENTWHVVRPDLQNLEEYISSLEEVENAPHICTMVQDQSHGLYRSQTPVNDELVRHACECVINIIERLFPGQVKNLRSREDE